MNKVEYISLGSDCCIAYHLQKYNLRNVSYPFDWIYTKYFAYLLMFFENDLNGLLNDIRIKNCCRNSFPFLETDDWNDENNAKSTCQRVVDSTYKFEFVHDFTSLDVPLGILPLDLNVVKEKYKRRIERFHTVMLDETIHKKLFRIGKKNEDITSLETCFYKLGYKNFSIYHQSYENFPLSNDWKREKFNFLKWFNV